jgi:hypothetical protein
MGQAGLVCGLFVSSEGGPAPKLPRVLGVYAGTAITSVAFFEAQSALVLKPEAAGYVFDLDFVDAKCWDSEDADTRESLSVMVDAYHTRNEMAFINDARGAATGINPLTNRDATLDPADAARLNVEFVNVAYDGLPYVIVIQTRAVPPGGELLCDYDRNYWVVQRRAHACKRFIHDQLREGGAALAAADARADAGMMSLLAAVVAAAEQLNLAPAAAEDVPSAAPAAAGVPAPGVAAGAERQLPSWLAVQPLTALGRSHSHTPAVAAPRVPLSASQSLSGTADTGTARGRIAIRAVLRGATAAELQAAARSLLDGVRIKLLQLDGRLPPVVAAIAPPAGTSCDKFYKTDLPRWRLNVLNSTSGSKLEAHAREYAKWLQPSVLREDWDAAPLQQDSDAAPLQQDLDAAPLQQDLDAAPLQLGTCRVETVVDALLRGVNDEEVDSLWDIYDAHMQEGDAGEVRYALADNETWHSVLETLMKRTSPPTWEALHAVDPNCGELLTSNGGAAKWRDAAMAALAIRGAGAAPPHFAARLMHVMRYEKKYGGLLKANAASKSWVRARMLLPPPHVAALSRTQAPRCHVFAGGGNAYPGRTCLCAPRWSVNRSTHTAKRIAEQHRRACAAPYCITCKFRCRRCVPQRTRPRSTSDTRARPAAAP